MGDIMTQRNFGDVNLNDPFFDSLKEDYREFPEWFTKKVNEPAWVMENEAGAVIAFLYTKREDGPVLDVDPPLPAKQRLKIGTMKILAHGTRLGERFMKKIMDIAIKEAVDEVYVTVFPKHIGLVALYERYGFINSAVKQTPNGTEKVFVKDLTRTTGHVLMDYPRIITQNKAIYLLSIYPDYHTRLFPDSILKTEPYDVIADVSHTNSIHKVYLCSMNVSAVNSGDILVIYRTSDGKGPAHYRSVATSICVVEEVKNQTDFPTVQSLVQYCADYSVFSREELADWHRRRPLYTIKMTYNAAFRRRLTRGYLIETIGLDGGTRWGFIPLTPLQFQQICLAGEIHESLIVN